MRNVFSKSILAATLIASPIAARAQGPATSPTTQAANQAQVSFTLDATLDLQARLAALDEARAARANEAEQLNEMRKRVRDLTGLVEVTPESVRQIIAHLQEQREALELDGAGAQGRRQALEEAVAALSKQLKERAQTDNCSASRS
jgi:chromosome segregation ATPase